MVSTEITRPNNNKSMGTIIDYIYIKGYKKNTRCNNIQYGTLQNGISDHYPIYINIKIKKNVEDNKETQENLTKSCFNRKKFQESLNYLYKNIIENEINN